MALRSTLFEYLEYDEHVFALLYRRCLKINAPGRDLHITVGDVVELSLD